jgi:hypothetical protein
LLRSPLPNHVADPLEFRYLGVEVVVECSALRCSWRAPPSRLLVVPMGLLVFWFLLLQDEALWMFVGGLFGIYVWFGWLFEL